MALLLVGGLALHGRDSADETNSIGMVLKPIPAGAFEMGQAEREKSYSSPWSAEKDTGADWDEFPVRKVTITKPFLMSATHVTNAQYEQFDPERHATGLAADTANDAVVNASWDDANAFCKWLSQKEGKSYRLPTEAEWEYACRAGTTTLFNTGNSLPTGYQQMSWLGGFAQFFPTTAEMRAGLTSAIDRAANSQQTQVGDLPPYYRLVKSASLLTGQGPANAWGLYDMHGLAEEWCSDWYAPYDPSQTIDPVGPVDGDFRVLRGGAYNQLARLLRSANRLSMEPWVRNAQIGFRVVQADPVPAPTATALPFPSSPNPPLPAPINQAVDGAKPYFAGPVCYVNIPQGEEGPLFGKHNHDPAIAVMPNGDVLILSYTCDTEFGHEMAVASVRLPYGKAVFSPYSLFWQCADANNAAPGLYVDKNGTVFHFNGNKAMPGSIVRTSTDSGMTWSHPQQINDDTQPNESNIRTSDGRILETCDSIYDNAGTITSSADDGKTWTKLSDESKRPVAEPGGNGPCIAGIHVGLIERKDGTLWALGRVDNQERAALFDHKLPISISTDGGKTWTYSKSEFSDITSGQRFTLKRLREGPLLLCSYTDDLAHRNAKGVIDRAKSDAEKNGMKFLQPDGTSKTGYGDFAALSYDDGATWPVKRLVTPVAPGSPAVWVESTDQYTPRCKLDADHGEPNGYMASCQSADGRIHLITSRNYYVFNLAWLTQGTPYAVSK